MKIIFAGTPEFASSALAALLRAGHEVPLVLTQPDRPAGRGLKLAQSAVKQLAHVQGIAVAQPRSLRLDGKFPEDAAAARQAILDAKADVMVVAAYGLILPQWVLDAPRLGCLNIHASLLPRWRGAAPIHRAIESGDAETGITIMQMDAGLDTGDMLLTERLPIAMDDTTTSLHDKLAALGGRSIVQAIEQAERAGLLPTRQPTEGITYAHKIDKLESRIDWAQPAAAIERKVRALDPFPGCTAQILGETVKINKSYINSKLLNIHVGKTPKKGTILNIHAQGIDVACGEDSFEVLTLTELQRAGGKRLPAADFVRGFALQLGQQFE